MLDLVFSSASNVAELVCVKSCLNAARSSISTSRCWGLILAIYLFLTPVSVPVTVEESKIASEPTMTASPPIDSLLWGRNTVGIQWLLRMFEKLVEGRFV